MFYRMELTYDELVHTLGVKYITGSTIAYTLLPEKCEISEINLMSKSLFPNRAKVTFTTDDIRLRPYLTTKKTGRFSKKSFF